MQNLHVTHGLVSEFREHRLAAGWGEDVLSLYDTLYHAYRSFPALRQMVLNRTTPHNSVPPLNDSSFNDQIVDYSAMGVDDSAMGVDDLPPQKLSKRDIKLQLRLQNEAENRLKAILAEREHKPTFDFVCPLCPGVSHFNRNGILSHL